MMTALQNLMMKMMSSCLEATHLVSEAFERPLSPKEWISLRFHLLLCRWCHRYEKQLRLLHKVACHHPETFGTAATAGLSTEARERIRRALEAPR